MEKDSTTTQNTQRSTMTKYRLFGNPAAINLIFRVGRMKSNLGGFL
jgi:hypothetical protein